MDRRSSKSARTPASVMSPSIRSIPIVMLAVAHQRRRHTWTLIHGGPESGLHKSTDGGKTWRRIRTGLAERRRRPHRHFVLARAEGTGLREGRSQRSRSRSTRRSTAARVGNDAATCRRSRCTTRTSTPIRRTPSASTCPASRHRSQTMAAGRSAGLASGTSTWTTTSSGSIRTTPLTCSKAATAGCTKAGTAARCGATSRTCRSRSSTTSKSTTPRRFTTSTAARRTTARSAGRHDRDRPMAPPTTTGSSSPAATASSRASIPTIPTSSMASRSTAASSGSIGARASASTSSRSKRKDEEALRFNWESPFIISPHSPSRLYFGASRLFRSDDRGNTWRAISPDLTRKTDRNLLPVMGRVWPPEAVAQHQSTATWGNISAVSESRKSEGMLHRGHRRWRRCRCRWMAARTGGRARHPPGLPDYGTHGVYVQRLVASKNDENVVYSLFDNSKNGDFKPYVYKSTNRGGSWTSISGDLPANGPALAFAEDHVNPESALCRHRVRAFLHRRRRQEVDSPADESADDRGARSRDSGARERSRARHVRSRLLRARRLLTAPTGERGRLPEGRAHLPGQGGMIRCRKRAKRRGSQGEQHWMAENPPDGAVITYWVRDAPRTLRQRRQDAGAGGGAEEGCTVLSVAGGADGGGRRGGATNVPHDYRWHAGKVVRRLTVPGGRGIHRFVWNLRGVACDAPGRRSGRWGWGRRWLWRWRRPGGSFVAPGTYRASLSRRVGGATTALGEATNNHGVGRSGRHAHAGAAHGRDRVSGQRREAAAIVHRCDGAGERHEDADDGDPSRDRRFHRGHQAARSSGRVRSPRHRGAACAERG